MSAPAAATVCETHTAPTNIAVIKYWGKRATGEDISDASLNVPINSSVSITLQQDDLCAKTTVVASPDFTADRLWLNGSEEDITRSARVRMVLSEIRKRAGDREVVASDGSKRVVPAAELAAWKVHIVSRNTFPTAAGLASSAAGYACLVDTLAAVYAVKETYAGELSTIARMGSGSACRSLYGGFVRWEKGVRTDGSDSLAVQVADEKHWDDLVVLIAVVSDKKKETGSTDGMKTSVDTSELIRHRANVVVPARLAAIEEAYKSHDFATFARIMMQDSNQFHAMCLDTYPPIFYMNDVSKRVIGLIHAINTAAGQTLAGYTFDAGPNAVIVTRRAHAAHVLSVLLAHFPAAPTTDSPYVSSPDMEATAKAAIPSLTGKLACDEASAAAGSLRHIYVTSIGDGPRVLPVSASLADPVTGMPFDTVKDDRFGKAL